MKQNFFSSFDLCWYFSDVVFHSDSEYRGLVARNVVENKL